MNILIVEDMSIISDALQMVLRSRLANVSTFVAQDSQQAQGLLNETTFDCASFDIDLGSGASGLDLLQSLRETPSQNSRMPVMMVSANDSMEDVQKSFRYGAPGFLEKGNVKIDEIAFAYTEIAAGRCFLSQAMRDTIAASLPLRAIINARTTGEQINAMDASTRALLDAYLRGYGLADLALLLGRDANDLQRSIRSLLKQSGTTSRLEFCSVMTSMSGTHA